MVHCLCVGPTTVFAARVLHRHAPKRPKRHTHTHTHTHMMMMMKMKKMKLPEQTHVSTCGRRPRVARRTAAAAAAAVVVAALFAVLAALGTPPSRTRSTLQTSSTLDHALTTVDWAHALRNTNLQGNDINDNNDDDDDDGGRTACHFGASKRAPKSKVGLDANVHSRFRSHSWVDGVAERFARAIRIATPSFDGVWDVPPSNPDVPDPQPHHRRFLDLHALLEELYPTVHSIAERWTVNRYSLVFRINGTDPTLKPLMLTSHLDVVPVDSASEKRWSHPPFSGDIDDDGLIWGRGTSDTKVTLIAIFEALETLLTTEINDAADGSINTNNNNTSSNWRPTRTILLAFGNDEESNSMGATRIAQFIGTDLGYAPQGIEVILDEGETLQPVNGSLALLSVGTAEKGYLDVAINVTAQGGHSSVPPRHTAIGVLSRILSRLEAFPHVSPLVRHTQRNVPVSHPGVPGVVCAAAYETPLLSPKLRKRALAVGRATNDDERRSRLAALAWDVTDARARFIEWRLATTQAIDVVSGGVKANALPEQAFASVNYRVDPFETGAFTALDSILDRVVDNNKEYDDYNEMKSTNDIVVERKPAETKPLRRVEGRLVQHVVLGALRELSAEDPGAGDWFDVMAKGVDDTEFHNVTHGCDGNNCGHLLGNGDGGDRGMRGDIRMHISVESRKFLAPSPVTVPDESSHWDVVIGTARHVFEHDGGAGGDDALHATYGTIAAVPALMAGNTDTARYWALSQRIFRFSPLATGRAGGVHTVDEHIAVADLVGAVVFMHEFVRNMDELR